MADTAIVTWMTKFDVDLWSPVTAITNGSADGNAATVQDSNWVSLLDTPNYPAYFAASGILKSFAGSGFAFSLGSDTDGDGIIDLTSNFSSLFQARDQANMSGVYGGTYMPQAGPNAAVSGGQIATFVLNNNFAAVPEPSGLLLVILSGLTLMRRRRFRA
jgi:hypothetical protein